MYDQREEEELANTFSSLKRIKDKEREGMKRLGLEALQKKRSIIYYSERPYEFKEPKSPQGFRHNRSKHYL